MPKTKSQENPKPANYWKDKGNIIAAVKEIMEEHKLTVPPNSTQLREWKRADVDNAISTYYGGYQQLRIDFGEKIAVRYGDGTDFNKLRDRAIAYLTEKGYSTLPPRKVMVADGQGALEASISRSIGISKFRKSIGVVPVRVERGSWGDLDYRIKKAFEAMKKEGVEELQSSRRLNELGYKSLLQAIYTYDRSFPEFRVRLENYKKQETERLKNLDYTLERAYEFMQEHPEYEVFPESVELVWHQRLDLLRAVTLPGRNLPHFREMLLNYMEKREGYDERDERAYKLLFNIKEPEPSMPTARYRD